MNLLLIIKKIERKIETRNFLTFWIKSTSSRPPKQVEAIIIML